METHVTYLVRVWLPDRPGALGLVASRLGAVKGDVIGLEIIERGGGIAVDELVVSLPSDVPIDLVAKEVGSVDDVEVEDIRSLDSLTYDPQIDVVEAAAILLGAETRDELSTALIEHVCRTVPSAWACLLTADGMVLESTGDRPNDQWLTSFIDGSPTGEPAGEGSTLPLEAIWLPLPAASLVLVLGGDNVIRAKERQRVAALTRVADAWFRRMKERSDLIAMALHPSRG
ncbi:MAG: hypothetical protein ACR2QO_08625 [Acidimicrobiales bacterium]